MHKISVTDSDPYRKMPSQASWKLSFTFFSSSIFFSSRPRYLKIAREPSLVEVEPAFQSVTKHATGYTQAKNTRQNTGRWWRSDSKPRHCW